MSLHRGATARAAPAYCPARISSRLWQGGAPPEGETLAAAGVDVLVLAAAEHQPPSACSPGVAVVHAGISDENRPPDDCESAMVEAAALAVVQSLAEGDRVLVTCWKGRNRSGLIVARALMLRHDLPAERAIRVVRANRGPDALSNPYFVRYLRAAEA